ISSISTSIMITTSNSPVKGSGMPNHYGGDLLHTMAMSGLSRVRTELLHFVVVPAAAPHPVQLDCQLARHRHLGDLAPTPQGERTGCAIADRCAPSPAPLPPAGSAIERCLVC